MAAREERCSHCGSLLIVPPEVYTFQCAVCHGISYIRIHNPLRQAYNSVSHAANRFRSFMNTIMTSSADSHANSIAGYGYQPPRLSSSLMPPPAYGPKRAVLCGICYDGRDRLKGSVNDAHCMKYLLINRFGFPSASILMLTDDKMERNPSRIPTKSNIRMALRWLIEGCRAGDSLVFYFSGHGRQEADLNMDEVDGYDEALCPVDYKHEGKILDDEINETIVRPLPYGAKLHGIIDACHSGTVLDLRFKCSMNREGYYVWEDQRIPIAGYKGTKGGLAICISACDDSEISVDTSALSGNEATGALTYSFIQSVENEPGLSYGRLLIAMRTTIREASAKVGIVGQNGPIASLLNRLLGFNIKQEPQLSSSGKFDIYSKRFDI